MKLEDYIKKEILRGRRNFNIKLNEKGEPDKKGMQSVKFSVFKLSASEDSRRTCLPKK